VHPDPEKPGKTFSTWPSRAVVCPACDHPYVKWENYAEHDWNAHARNPEPRGRRGAPAICEKMNRPALLLLLAFLLAEAAGALK
jgi:hypothetical protein